MFFFKDLHFELMYVIKHIGGFKIDQNGGGTVTEVVFGEGCYIT
jgi:hypothetical protein